MDTSLRIPAHPCEAENVSVRAEFLNFAGFAGHSGVEFAGWLA
jgi:hypothetical protein